MLVGYLILALPALLLVAGIPHLVRAVLDGWWRILYLILIAGFAATLRLTTLSGNDAVQYLPYGILALASFCLFARGFRLFAIGLGASVFFYFDYLRPYIDVVNMIRLALVLALAAVLWLSATKKLSKSESQVGS